MKLQAGKFYQYGARLRHALLLVVLLNLVFVQLTGAVAAHWLGPMYVLTIAAAWLHRLHRHLLYRSLWNASVLGIFALLVHHASAGIQFLLEDGLMLAAFCQVHLLNNLERQQKPDLLFFNSFLIALVTSFFCQDLAFALVFTAYVAALVVALQLAISTHGDARSAAADRLPPGMLRDVMTKAGGLLACTMALFVVLPRDFQREGLVAQHLLRATGSSSGFSEEVELGRNAPMTLSDRVVLRIRPIQGGPGDVPALWRGATFDRFAAGRWRAVTEQQGFRTIPGRPWQRRSDQSVQRDLRPGEAVTARVTVAVEDPSADRLFCPLESVSVRADTGTDTLYVEVRCDGTLGVMRGYQSNGEPLSFDVDLHARPPQHAPEPRHGADSRWLSSYLHLIPGTLPEAAARRAATLVQQVGPGAPQAELVEALRRQLASGHAYRLPGQPGAARDLAHFFGDAEGGHCEYFATALALMLRSLQVPARLVTGFLCSTWDEEHAEIVVRARDAHAWVEVLDPAGFWYAVDATPAVDREAQQPTSALAAVWAWLGSTWTSLTGFDDEARRAAVTWLRSVPGRLARAAADHPWRTALGLGLLAVALWLWRRRRPQAPAAVRSYHRALRRARLQALAGETPREVLARARAAALRPARLLALEAATAAHERVRYGGARQPSPRPARTAARRCSAPTE